MCALQGKGIWTLYDDIDTAVSHAPEVGAKYILCKVSKHGKYSPENAAAALAKVRTNPDLVPVAWTFSYLMDVDAEVDCARCALEAGFEAFIIDAEAEINLKFDKAEQFAKRMVKMGIDPYRVYLCSDPRLDAKIDEIPCTKLAQACKGGFMPMIYGEIWPSDRQHAANQIIKTSYAQYERHRPALGYTTPLMPVLASYWDNQGKARMTYAELKAWCREVESHHPTFVSLYRAGVTTDDAWQAFKELQVSGSIIFDKNVYVQPNGPGYMEVFYPPHQPGSGWKEFVDLSGNLTRYRPTSSSQTMYCSYHPVLPGAGRYIVETFIPGTHATTKGAQYFVVHHPGGLRQEAPVVINQLSYSDQWVPLGSFDLDPAQTESGRVNLVDITNDSKIKEIAFTAIRWRPVVKGAAGFDSPVGTAEERASTKVWPGNWIDANPYLRKYDLGYHTGADLNLNLPVYDSDRLAPIYAAANGVVTYGQVVPNSTWGGLIVIRHEPTPEGKPVYTRYGHVENILVRPGDTVSRGQQIAQVGYFGKPGKGNYHLHFDISNTTLFEKNPRHWPSFNINEIRKHYVDPRKFIEDHRP